VLIAADGQIPADQKAAEMMALRADMNAYMQEWQYASIG